MKVVSLVGTTLRLAVPLYLSTVLLGLVPAGLGMLGVAMLAGDRPWRADLLRPGWLNAVAEIVMTAFYARDPTGISLLIVAGLVVFPVAFVGQIAAYSFLAGGILETLRAPDGAPTPFWAACRRWFWPFLRLSVLGGVLAVAVVVLGAVISALARPVIGPDLSAIFEYALQSVVFGWLELARAQMVVATERSVGRALGQAGWILRRPLVLLLWLLLSLPGLGLMFAAILPPSVDDPFSAASFVVALLYGQLVVFAGAWTKVVRLAVAFRLARHLGPAPRSGLLTSRASALPGRPEAYADSPG